MKYRTSLGIQEMLFFKRKSIWFVRNLRDSVVVSGWSFLTSIITYCHHVNTVIGFSVDIRFLILCWGLYSNVCTVYTSYNIRKSTKTIKPVRILCFSEASQGQRMNRWEMSTIASITFETTRLTVDLSTPMQSPTHCKKLPLAKNLRVIRTC